MPVAPVAGAWIEIARMNIHKPVKPSLPSRERGLKFRHLCHPESVYLVAPFAGAWIEILAPVVERYTTKVAPFAGAWIEILKLLCICWGPLRRSLRGSVD